MARNRPIYLLSPSKYPDTIYMPMIQFEIIADRLDLDDCDTLMFTSKQAVKSAEEIDPDWKKLPSIAIGAATKKEIESFGGSVLYHPSNYYGSTLAKDIVEKFASRKILYLRPKSVSFDSASFLVKHNIELQEQIIYKTSCVKYETTSAPVDNAIIIFTSPSSIRCFLSNFEWRDSYTAVVIGKSTQVHLPSGAKFAVAQTPMIESCIDKAKELTQQ